IEASRFARECQSPLSEPAFEKCFVEPRQVADFAYAHRMQILFSHLADTGDLAHVERRKKSRFVARHYPQDPVWLGLIGRDFRNQPGGGDSDRAVETRFG